MIHKRPLTDDSQEVACKHPRQWEDTSHFSSVINGVNPNSALQNPQIPEGKWEDIYSKYQDEGRFDEDQCNKVLSGTNKEYGTSTSGCVPHFWWINSNGIDAHSESEVAVHLPLFPEYFAAENQIRAFLHSDEIYSPLCSPRKLVSIGPEHQADIPEWSQQDPKNSSDCLDTSDPQAALKSSCAGIMFDDDCGKMTGTRVIPMPDSEATAKVCYENVGQRIDCECLDPGSIRCIRQHVKEAREKLRQNLGLEMFRELGFCDMGEEVANRWTEEEELAFHSVVLSNPVSLGKNFWDHLPAVFPSHTKKDFVSYYFNVFMLRKRAEQNRVDPEHIDSDDDELQTAECEIPAEDDDSVVESPADQGTYALYEDNQEEDFYGDIENEDEGGVDSSEYIADDICRAASDGEEEGDIDEISEPLVECFICNYDSRDFQFSSKVQGSKKDDYDNQDDSCTSYEYQGEKGGCCDPPETVMDANQPSQE